MDKIIEKAITGGFDKDVYKNGIDLGLRDATERAISTDDGFWKSLATTCKWKNDRPSIDWWLMGRIGESGNVYRVETANTMAEFYALRFHEINLTKGWDEALAYLEELTK